MLLNNEYRHRLLSAIASSASIYRYEDSLMPPLPSLMCVVLVLRCIGVLQQKHYCDTIDTRAALAAQEALGLACLFTAIVASAQH
jgi:hypothetical protein